MIHLRRGLYISFLLIILPLKNICAQKTLTGQVIDHETKLPVSFASIALYSQGVVKNGVITNSNGKFSITNASEFDSIVIHNIGYQNKSLIKNQLVKEDIVIELIKESYRISEVIIEHNDLVAETIIDKVIQRRKYNNYQNIEYYNYLAYIKYVYDIKLSKEADRKDSLKVNSHISNNSLFICEQIIEYTNNNDDINKKTILQNTSGTDNPIFADLFESTFHHALSFYKENISIVTIDSPNKFLTNYLSPISFLAPGNYDYTLQNTFYERGDTIYVINFFPKRNKNFNALKGTLYINSNGYAIQSIIAQPAHKTLITFKFKQEYEFIEEHWFPCKLESEIGFANLSNQDINAYTAYTIKSYIDSVVFKKTNTGLSNFIAQDSSKQKMDILIQKRAEPLTFREENTYSFVDSIFEKNNLNKKISMIPKLLDGYYPVQYFDIDLNRILLFNRYEYARIGLGIRTNKKLSQFIAFEGFSGWGIKDKALKYGAGIHFYPLKKKDVQFTLFHQKQLKEQGTRIHFGQNRNSFNDYIRQTISSNFDQALSYGISLQSKMMKDLDFKWAFTINKIQPLYIIPQSPQFKYRTNEVMLNFKYSPNRKITKISNSELIKHQGNPIIEINYIRGLRDFNERLGIPFNRISANFNYTVFHNKIGQTNLNIEGGYISQDLPYFMHFTGEGSKNKTIPISIDHSFQTMKPYEFGLTQFINIFFKHNIADLLFSTPKFNPKFMFSYSIGLGDLNNNFPVSETNHEVDNSIYLESGVEFNNMLKLNYYNLFYLGFGVGAYYRHGQYSYKNVEDNFAVKAAITTSF